MYIYTITTERKNLFSTLVLQAGGVASGELWFEFTNTGLNPGSMSGINYDDKFSDGYGMNMYMQKWKDGPTSYFPDTGNTYRC